MNLMGRDAKAAGARESSHHTQETARKEIASRPREVTEGRPLAARYPPAAAKPGPPWHGAHYIVPTEDCPQCEPVRALEARVKELEAALREAKRAMDSYAPKGEPSLRGRYDTRAQRMVDAALREQP